MDEDGSCPSSDEDSSSSPSQNSGPAAPQNLRSNKQSQKKKDPGLGGQYETNVPAYFALKLNSSQEVKDFSMRSNVAVDFGNLDDVILDVTLENGETLHFAFQLKQCENVEKNVYPGSFEGAKNDFSLEKYCTAFKKMPSEIKDKYHFIIYTCRYFDKKKYRRRVTKFDMLEDDQCPGKNFFETSSDKSNTFKFRVNDNTPSSTVTWDKTTITKDDYEEFFSKLTLYTCQKNVEEFEELIREILEEYSAGYLDLFRKWHQFQFVDKTFDRKTINAHLVDICLSSCMVTDYRLSDHEYQKMFLFEKITKEFDATVIDEPIEDFKENLKRLENVDKILLKSAEDFKFKQYRTLYKMGDATLTECMLRLAQQHKFIEKKKKLDEKTRKKIFCFYFQHLLIVDFNHRSEKAIYKLMDVYRIKEDRIKFILLGNRVDFSKLSSVQKFQNLYNLSRKNDRLYQEVTALCMVSFPGRRSVTLKQLVESFEDVMSVFKTKEIVEMLKVEYSPGEELPQHYVPRNVSTTVFDLDTILNSVQDDKLIVIVGLDDKDVQTKKKLETKGISSLDISAYAGNCRSFPEKFILSTKKPNSAEEIEQVCVRASGKDVHAFQMISKDTLILIRSTCGLDCEQPNVRTFSQEEIHCAFGNTLNLLVAEPGMGKSTLMRYLINECPCNLWPIYVDLKYHPSLFRGGDEETVLADLVKTSPGHSGFFGKLIDFYKQRKRIVLFLDSLDALSTERIEKVLNAVQNLTRKGHRVWLSFRQNLEERLTRKFNLFSLRLVELCKDKQERYIKSLLSESLENEEDVVECIDCIFDRLRIVNKENFLETPLHVSIITEAVLDDRKNDRNMTNSFFAPTRLYRHFFEGRYQHCFGSSKTDDFPQPRTLTEYSYYYEIAALQYIFEEESLKRLKVDYRLNNEFLGTIQTQVDTLGIVAKVERQKAIFEDPTCAEYFACVWFENNLDQLTLLKEELFSPKYEHLLFMLNMKMAEEKNPLHVSIIYRNVEQCGKQMQETDSMDSRDKIGRTALHIACCSGPKYLTTEEIPIYPAEALPAVEPQEYMTMIEPLFTQRSILWDKKNLFDFDCLEYALASQCLCVIEIALRKQLIEFDDCKRAIFQHHKKEELAQYCQLLNCSSLLKEIQEANVELLQLEDVKINSENEDEFISFQNCFLNLSI